jgi:hypothetical protein
VGKDELNVVIAKEIVKPVPSGCRLDDSLMRAGQRMEIVENMFRDVLDALLFDD